MQLFDLEQSIIHVDLAAFQAFSFTFFFVYKSNQYFIYDYLQPITPQITQDT